MILMKKIRVLFIYIYSFSPFTDILYIYMYFLIILYACRVVSERGRGRELFFCKSYFPLILFVWKLVGM